MDGDGDATYKGGGVLITADFLPADLGWFHAEASLRMGGIENDYGSDELRDFFGRTASYESWTNYMGAHFGLGHTFRFNDSTTLDIYGKYFWTRQEGDSMTLSTGEKLEFDDVNSKRLRLGGRLEHVASPHFSPYVGAAWEYEFDGRARATTNGCEIDAPSLRGSTGIGEIGITFTPVQNLPLSIDLNAQGYVGRREGFTGNLQIRYEF